MILTPYQNIFVTGGAGFIGSTLVDTLLQAGKHVTVFDNFSTGLREFLPASHQNLQIIKGDLKDLSEVTRAMQGIDFVFHLAANADIRGGINDPFKDIKENILATSNLLAAMRTHNVKKIAFSSTSAIYGDTSVFPTPENVSIPHQTSFYGTSKIAAENLIQNYVEAFGFQSWIFRFVSVLGERYPHGHVYDFYFKLKHNPNELTILGNGKQQKSYFDVEDCISAMCIAVDNARDPINTFNLGRPDMLLLDNSVDIITEYLHLHPKRVYTGGDRGWVGDIPRILLDITRIRNLGWEPKVSLKDSIIKTVQWLQANEWIEEKRKPIL